MPMKVVPRRDRKLHRLVKKGETLSLKRGETLYLQGDSAKDLILVRTGHLQLVANPGSSAERVVSVAGPWELTGEEGARRVPWRWQQKGDKLFNDYEAAKPLIDSTLGVLQFRP